MSSLRRAQGRGYFTFMDFANVCVRSLSMEKDPAHMVVTKAFSGKKQR
jgi:hypothetical protein